jgi:dGTPase
MLKTNFRDSIQLAKDLDSILAPYAIRYSTGKFRPIPEVDDKFRTRFQVDRDRILHSKAFRRLKNKTQVFSPYTGDHFRDRLTHTLEVSQIARSLARVLSVNEDLAEVIALSHDLGHTPFGHAGEYALRDCMQKFGLYFEHNEQSQIVVSEMNLNYEVFEGLQKHQTPYDQVTNEFVNASIEAQVVNYADEIAYHNHDLDDGIRSGILAVEDFTQLALFRTAAALLPPDLDPINDRLKFISQIMKIMIEDLVTESYRLIQENNILTLEDVYKCPKKLVQFSQQMKLDVLEMRKYLYQNFYHHLSVTNQTEQGQHIIKSLFDFYLTHPEKLPATFQSRIESDENNVIIVKDYISGMTDNYATNKFKEYALS